MSEGRFNLSALAVRERAITLFLICLISLGGLLAFFKLGRAEDPSFTIKVMTIVTAWPGATPQEMQDQVTEKLEKRLQELRWYDRSETFTRPGLAFTTLTLLDSTPPAEVEKQFYQARKKLSDEAVNLPSDVIGPMVNDEYSDVTFALYALKAKGEPQRLLVRDAETLRQRLLHVPGVKKVNIVGERPERIYVEFSHERLATLGVSPQDVFAALNGQNALTPAGSIETKGPQVFIRLDGAFDELQKIRDTPVTAQGRTLKLSDVATVKRGYEDPATFLVRNAGEPALLLGVVMRDGWNGLDLGKALDSEVGAINAEQPLGLGLTKVTDQAVNISASVDEFMVKFFAALLVVMVVCFVSMGWRVGVVVAAAVPLVSYHTAWLKTHYPAEFMAATISSDMDNTDKAVTFIDESKAIGLKVLPPDVNASEFMFVAVEPKVIRYGLGAIKGVGQGACEAIAEERKRGGEYKDLADFCRRVDSTKLNRRVLEALILSGSLDALAPNRASLMAQLPNAMKAADQHLKNKQSGQNDMFGAMMGATAPTVDVDLPTVTDWPLEQILQGERDTLGHYLSGHPTDPWKDELAQLSTCPLGEIGDRYQPPKPRKSDGDDNRFRRGPDTPWTVAGMVTAVRKRGDSDAFVRLEDGTGIIEVSFFGDLYQQVAPMLTRDQLMVVEGGLRIDDFSGGGFALRARSAYTLGDACRRFARLLRLKLNGVNPTFIDDLRRTLAGYRGGRASVVLHGYHNATAQADLELGEDWRVDAIPELLRAIRAVPGVEAAKLRIVKSDDRPRGGD